MMDFESAMQTFAEAWMSANSTFNKKSISQSPQQQQQQRETERSKATTDMDGSKQVSDKKKIQVSQFFF